MTFHVGDIKSGSSRCDDPYYAMVKAQFDRFDRPLLYTPGDNEWTDCHRPNNGGYNPLERLDHTRQVFFGQPGRTLGQRPTSVVSQQDRGVPENVRLDRQGVRFATVHVVGSNDDLAPWAGLGHTTPTARQSAEQQQRMSAAIANVKTAFAEAKRKNDRAVVVFTQADMFDPTFEVTWGDASAFQPLVQTLITESNAFDGETYLINGDSHVYNHDNPLAAGSKWLSFYGVEGSSALTRVTVNGSANNVDWLRFTINKTSPVLTWQRVPYRFGAANPASVQ